MKNKSIFIAIVCACVVAFSIVFGACKSNNNTGTEIDKGYNETTKELINMVNANPELGKLLTKAIEKGKAINPDKKTNPVQSLEEYYDFVDYSQKVMPWDVIFCPGQPTIFGRMYQALCYCYFINCMPLEELENKNFFTNSVQYVEPYGQWLVKYCK